MPARLPSAADLGGLPGLNSGRPIATYDVSSEARGAERMARGFQDLGAGLMSAGEAQQKKADNLQEALADAAYRTGKIKIDEARGDETDPDVLSNYKSRYEENLNSAAGQITDESRRQLWLARRASDVEAGQVAANSRAFDLRKDAALAGAFERLNDLQKTAASAKTDEDRTAAIDDGNKLIASLNENGYISDLEAAKRRQAWANGYAVEAFRRLSPQQRLEALTPVQVGERSKRAFDFFTSQGWRPEQAAGIVGNLIHESGLRTNARNPGDGTDGSDSIGIAQWNSDRAERLKRFAASLGTSPTDFDTQLKFVDLELRTSHMSAGDALTGATTARDAAAAFVTKFERPAGSNRGAEASHGWSNRLRQSEAVLAKFGGGAPLSPTQGEGLKRFITPDQQIALRDEAERDWRRQQINTDAATRDEIATVKRLVSDDALSVASTGKPVEELTTQRVERALGPEAAQKFEENRAIGNTVYNATFGFPQMTNEAVAATAERFRPTEGDGGDGFARKATIYKEINDRAEAVINERATDPARAVEGSPKVREATARLGQEPSQANTEGLVRARLEAQESLGIPSFARSPIPLSEAKLYAEKLRPLARGQAEAANQNDIIQGVVGEIQQRYGQYAKDVLQRVLYQVTLKRDASEVLATALNRMTTTDAGPVVTTDETRRVETATQADAVQQWTGGTPEFSVDGVPQAALPSQAPQKSFIDAVDTLRKDPDRLLPFFIQRYGIERVPADLRAKVKSRG